MPQNFSSPAGGCQRAEWAHTTHLFGPLLIRSPNPRLLHGPFRLGIWIGPFPIWEMDWPLSSWGYVPAPAFTFIGRKNGTLMPRQHWYNDVLGWYRARMEHLFGQLWHWGLVRNIGFGGSDELHQFVPVLLHFTPGKQPPSLLHVANLLGMKYFGTLTIREKFFEYWLQNTRCNSKRGPESCMGQKKKFSDIWRSTPLGKLKASAAWKKCLENLMGGSGWEKCVRGHRDVAIPLTK